MAADLLSGVQTFLFAGRSVVDVIPPSLMAAVKSESCFHGCFSQR